MHLKVVTIKKIESTRRTYNRLVADETLEDYSLRYTPKSFRKWSELLIANTALGSISFLALEAIGASIAISYGFSTAFWAILTASIIIFLTAIPISYHAARYNIDIDLITRSAGFGYVGSTITSLIYASFSFIFFALEAAIMAQALELYLGLPLALGYLLSSVIIIPIVFYGITLINKLQMWSQPIWLIMMVAPFIAVLMKEPQAIENFINFSGTVSLSSEFNVYHFGFAIGISLSLIAQIGEQVDYIRFMPPLKQDNKFKWWTSMLFAGPGWIILGFLKQIGGIFLASIVLLSGLSLYEAKTPIQMYYIAYEYIFDNPEVALASATFFVIISQIKINVTNAYAGSLAWSNFFSRLTHSHPGRVVWMVFNISIALMLMELGLFDVLENVLGLYSNVAIAWIGAITADLVINKPLGLSPKIIEFKRAYLFNINPVGVGSMGMASVVSIISFMGVFGDIAQSYSSIIAMTLAFTLSPLIAYLTKGKYYIARHNGLISEEAILHKCGVCDNEYEKEDMAFCPVYDVKICSLCCSLDSLCHDVCKKESKQTLRIQLGKYLKNLFFNKLSTSASLRLFDFFTFSFIILFILAVTIWMVYSMQTLHLDTNGSIYLQDSFITLFFIISIFIFVLVGWALLMKENRELAEKELFEQYKTLEESRIIIDFQANHDHLTGIGNRVYFNDRLSSAIKNAKINKTDFALFFIDLDKFKNINDTLGHLIGDKVLKVVADRLCNLIRTQDTISRLNGNEFVLIINQCKDQEYATILAKAILKSLNEPILLGKEGIDISCSIGISFYPQDYISQDKLIMNADLAMHDVKSDGRNGYKFYEKDMTSTLSKNMSIEKSLKNALIDEEFLVYYQPQVDIKTQKVTGMEALFRWKHQKYGVLEPDQFLNLKDATDLSVKIDKLIMKQAMYDFTLWHTYDLNPKKLSFNINIKQLLKEDFIKELTHTMNELRFKPIWLEFELTEEQLIFNEKGLESRLEEISKMGITLAIDNYGTGYSSVQQLKKFNISKIKIDASLILDLSEKEVNKDIIKAIITLHTTLGLRVIAQGVNTKEQKDFLQDNGCEIIQGSLYSKPVPAEMMKTFLIKGL
ncbi:EAL domain-containing protein [Sulfurimonas sp. MAG313]|nr:EAL domain-containing protein [Sulfurimonas sp. MAG313]MDF1881764.1 EAL domain-containing protein [Sulfurimonas sp. MAG313]